MRQDQRYYEDEGIPSEMTAKDYDTGGSSRASRTSARGGFASEAMGKVASLLPRGRRTSESRSSRPSPAPRPREEDGARRPRQATSQPRAQYSGDDYQGTGEPCRVCGRPVEPSMSRCPHCGSLRVPLYRQVPFWVAVVVLVALVVLLSVAVNSCAGGASVTEPASPSEPTSPVASDKSALQQAITEGQGYIDQNTLYGTYTVATVMDLQSAMALGQAALDDDGATEDEVNEAVQAISSAVGSLRECPTGYDGYSSLDYQTLVNSATAGLKSNSSGSGVILSISTGTDGTTLSVAFGGDQSSVINVLFNDLSVANGEMVEGASVSFAGTVTGLGKYGDASVPTLVADYVDVIYE